MSILRARHIVGAMLILGAGAYLGYAGLSSNWVYYQDIDSFVRQNSPAGKRVRLHGRVSDRDADIRPLQLQARFTVEGSNERLAVEYRGAVPELLKPGCEVVVEGQMGPSGDGVFQADVVLTKCTSKYTSGAAAHQDQPGSTGGDSPRGERAP